MWDLSGKRNILLVSSPGRFIPSHTNISVNTARNRRRENILHHHISYFFQRPVQWLRIFCGIAPSFSRGSGHKDKEKDDRYTQTPIHGRKLDQKFKLQKRCHTIKKILSALSRPFYFTRIGVM